MGIQEFDPPAYTYTNPMFLDCNIYLYVYKNQTEIGMRQSSWKLNKYMGVFIYIYTYTYIYTCMY